MRIFSFHWKYIWKHCHYYPNVNWSTIALNTVVHRRICCLCCVQRVQYEKYNNNVIDSFVDFRFSMISIFMLKPRTKSCISWQLTLAIIHNASFNQNSVELSFIITYIMHLKCISTKMPFNKLRWGLDQCLWEIWRYDHDFMQKILFQINNNNLFIHWTNIAMSPHSIM